MNFATVTHSRTVERDAVLGSERNIPTKSRIEVDEWGQRYENRAQHVDIDLQTGP